MISRSRNPTQLCNHARARRPFAVLAGMTLWAWSGDPAGHRQPGSVTTPEAEAEVETAKATPKLASTSCTIRCLTTYDDRGRCNAAITTCFRRSLQQTGAISSYGLSRPEDTTVQSCFVICHRYKHSTESSLSTDTLLPTLCPATAHLHLDGPWNRFGVSHYIGGREQLLQEMVTSLTVRSRMVRAGL